MKKYLMLVVLSSLALRYLTTVKKSSKDGQWIKIKY